MVQSYQSPVRVYKYPFELVMAAYVRRFPTCSMIPIMVGTEIVTQEMAEDDSREVITRLCKLNVEAPYLLKKIMGVEFIYFKQTNVLDRRNRTLNITAINESFVSRVDINEQCKYFVHPENPEWTCFEQSASLEVKTFFGFEKTVENLAMKQYSQNISKGKEIIEYFIQQMRDEGIVSVPVWQPRSKKNSLKRASLSRMSSKEGEVKEESLTVEGEESESHLSSEESSAPSETLCIGASASSQKKSEGLCPEGLKPAMSDLLQAVQQEPVQPTNRRKDTLAKLDSDYIKRCLGDLSPLQESRLVQLKKWVSELQKGKVPSDTTLLRFLRARDFNLEKAREMLSHSLIWRKKNQVDKTMAEYQEPKIIKDYFPGGWHYHDKDGRPLYLLRLGQMDVKGLAKSVGEEGLLRHTLYICEEGLRLTSEATNSLGRPVTTWTLLVDLEGLNMRHLWRPGIKTLLKIIEIVENNYPETMSHVLIIRAPRVFPILWTLVSSFIDENTRTKFLFYGGNDYQCSGGLVDFMDKEFIPDFLGGECTLSLLYLSGPVPESLNNFTYQSQQQSSSTVVESGLVPKSLYLPGEDSDGVRHQLSLSDQSLYHSVSLAKGQVHEALLLIEEAGAVICWDFDVMKSDVLFSVLRTKVPITHPKEPHSPTGALGVIDAVMGGDDLHRSVIERGWKEGIEYFRVEPPLVCHDGESVQGSHVTSSMGTYILQWKYSELPHGTSHGSPLDIIDTITSHKAKIMYCHETLNSADYKGSMTSLQSCQSGFSHLSSTTGKSSLNSSCPSR